jgi:cell division inhibitor SepF
MGAMYRLKAYFGMVPADELTEYVDDPVDHYPAPRRSRENDDRWARRDDPRWEDKRWTDRSDRADEGWVDDRWAPAHADHHQSYEGDSYEDSADGSRADDQRRDGASIRRPARPALSERRRPTTGLPASTPIRGALAMDSDAVHEPVRPVTAVANPAAPEQRDRVATLAKITTLQPTSYKEARTIGERYRDGVPVIMNLTELDAADAKRLVDFAAGLVFALRGGFDKIANRVFLLTPADVEVSADDARKLAERGLFRQD